MATQERTVAILLDQLKAVSGMAARKMFGEYGLSCGGKPVGVICNDQLYLKITPQGRELAAGATEEAPYPGASPALRIDSDRWDDHEWMSRLVLITAQALPPPKPKKRRTSPAPLAGT